MKLRYLRQAHAFRTLIDIGANDGSMAQHLSRSLGIARVIAFEPLPVMAAALRERGFETHSLALSDRAGEIRFRASTVPAASSALALTAEALAEWPDIGPGEDIVVAAARLDDEVGHIEDDLLIKLDAQGAEVAIIRGGPRTFARAACVLIEQTFVPLYRGQGLFNQVHAELAALGLELTGFRGQHLSETTGRPLFAHCVYERAAAR